ncbi:MAG: hypothetical protein IAE78_30700, partial [Myxococcus sp.]|nr:hypothetical protein [Myxococcus sp.]
ASCTSNPNSACQNGVIDCSSGSGVCVNGTNKMNGTACTGGVCNVGMCTPCVAGASCTPANPCKTGNIVCSSGTPVCAETGNTATGSACPGGVCNTGSCVACSAGTACTGNPTQCKTGVISCSSGGPVCVDGANAADYTACTGGRCVSGSCCTGCTTSTPTCAPGDFSVSACGTGGVACRVCPSCPRGRIRTCDFGVCFCDF